jgi:hypothetical protein
MCFPFGRARDGVLDVRCAWRGPHTNWITRNGKCDEDDSDTNETNTSISEFHCLSYRLVTTVSLNMLHPIDVGGQ